MSEELNNEVMRRAEVVLQDLEKEISELPKAQVWCCKNTDQIEDLINRMEMFIESCYMAMSGTIDKTRDMLGGMIEKAEDEKIQAEGILYSLKR